jgi:hypothetical protein
MVADGAALANRREAPMHAVVVRSTVHDVEQGRKFLKEEAIPRLSQVPGFVAAQWVKLDDDNGTSMLTFESEHAARTAAEQLRTSPPPSSVVTINTIEVGEVVGRA